MSMFIGNQVQQYNIVNDTLPTMFFFKNNYNNKKTDCSNVKTDNINPYIINKNVNKDLNNNKLKSPNYLLDINSDISYNKFVDTKTNNDTPL